MHAHHRQLRSAGGPDCPCNLLALCGRCHAEHVHAYPRRARDRGWIISRFDDREPGQVPVRLDGADLLLSCSGERIVFVRPAV